MSYETAPATLLIATHCAVCNRALVDSVSVEAGIGPDCRAKHGYGEAQGAPDYAKAARTLATENAATADELAAWVLLDAQSFANKLVHRVACAATANRPSTRGACIVAIAALGFDKLARILARAAKGICVDEVGGMLVVVSPFSPAFNDAARKIPGTRWVKNADGKGGARHIPESSRGALWAALKTSYPKGTPVFGTKGTTVL
jgi:hypothetical protein